MSPVYEDTMQYQLEDAHHFKFIAKYQKEYLLYIQYLGDMLVDHGQNLYITVSWPLKLIQIIQPNSKFL